MGGPQYRPQDTILLLVEIAESGPLVYGHPDPHRFQYIPHKPICPCYFWKHPFGS